VFRFAALDTEVPRDDAERDLAGRLSTARREDRCVEEDEVGEGNESCEAIGVRCSSPASLSSSDVLLPWEEGKVGKVGGADK